MTSLWEQTAEISGFESLNGSIKTDVLIIGGGMAGILCAYMLHQAGVPYVLAEAQTVCSGITKMCIRDRTPTTSFNAAGKETAPLLS